MQPGRRFHLMHLASEDPQQDVGNHDRQPDRDHRLAQLLPLHVAQDQHLDQQTRHRSGSKPGRHPEHPPASALGDDEGDITTEQVQRTMRKIDVAHQAKNQREAAGNDEIQRRQRQRIEQRDEVQAGVVEHRPEREDRDRATDQQPQREALRAAHQATSAPRAAVNSPFGRPGRLMPRAPSGVVMRTRAPWRTRRPSSPRGCVSGRAGSTGSPAGRRRRATGRRENRL